MQDDYEIGLFLEGSRTGQSLQDIKQHDQASGITSGVVYLQARSEKALGFPDIVVAVGPRLSDTDKSMNAVLKRAGNIRKALETVTEGLYQGKRMSDSPRLYDKEGRVYDLTTSGIQLERVKSMYCSHTEGEIRDNTLYFLPRPTEALQPSEVQVDTQTPVVQENVSKGVIVPSNGFEMKLSFFKIDV